MSAPLSRVVLYDKDDFLGRWEHTATLVDGGGSTAIEGAATDPRLVEWLFYEDLLVATDGVQPALALWIDGHYTEGTFANGDRCLVADERPWHEHTHARIDWWMDEAAALSAVPIAVEEPVLEPVPFDLSEIPTDEELWPRFERDEAGQLVSVETRMRYWLMCAGCTTGPVDVTHRFVRLD